MTGKGDRWGRDSVGRSAPAFLSANTFALPHLPARREAGQLCGSCCFAARPANCGRLCFEACAGRRVRWLCLPAVALFSRLCLPAVLCSAGLFACRAIFACHAHCPQQFAPVQLLCPRSISFCFAPVHSMCARIIVV